MHPTSFTQNHTCTHHAYTRVSRPKYNTHARSQCTITHTEYNNAYPRKTSDMSTGQNVSGGAILHDHDHTINEEKQICLYCTQLCAVLRLRVYMSDSLTYFFFGIIENIFTKLSTKKKHLKTCRLNWIDIRLEKNQLSNFTLILFVGFRFFPVRYNACMQCI